MPQNGPELRDIHVPHVSMWWPLAPGWWVLAILLVAGAVALVIVWRRRMAWRRFVDGSLSDLRDAMAKYAADGDALAFTATASQLVRRVARTRDVRSVALSGQAWHDALSAMTPKHDVTPVVALDTAKYRRNVDIDVAATARDVEAWVRAALRRGRGSHVPA